MKCPLPLCLVLAGLGISLAPVGAQAQDASRAAGPDSLHLGALHSAALRQDPRGAQLGLIEARTESRLRGVAADRLPSIDLQARGQYQSDVPSIPFDLPGAARPPIPPRDTYDAYLAVRQSLYDPSLAARRRLEVAAGEEAGAEVTASLYEVKERVNEAFFAVLRLRIQMDEVEAGAAAIEAHLSVIAARVAERSALPSEEATLRRELLQRRQALAALAAQESAWREQLELLTGVPVSADTELPLPDLTGAVAALRGDRRTRPEYRRFDRARELLERRSDALSARRQPRVSAFGRGGYGRPGLNPLSTELDSYWLAGVQVDWAPWQRGSLDAERAELELERRILDTREAAFSRELESAVVNESAVMDQLEQALVQDDEIVTLSEEIVTETRLRFAEAVITSAELVAAESDLLRARMERSAHRVGLERARARLLTITGYELP